MKKGVPKQNTSIPKAVYTEDFGLPASYGINSVTLMARDPFWIYAYWDISKDILEKSSKKYPLVLRMYDVTLISFNGRNANHYFDIDVGYSTKNWHINLWCDNVSYVAELGTKNKKGGFSAIARSNTVTTPRSENSNRKDQIWMKVTDDHKSDPFVLSNRPGTGQEIKNDPIEKTSTQIELPHKGLKTKKKAHTLSENDIRNYYINNFTDLNGVKVKNKKNPLKPPKHQADPRIKSIGASESISSFIESKFIDRKFFFELNTELIVYGRTEPDAQLWMAGKKINIKPDGTFSMRMALPEGKLPFNFTAVSNDKAKTKTIKTTVFRKNE